MWQFFLSFISVMVIYLYLRKNTRKRKDQFLESAIKTRQLLREKSIGAVKEKLAEVPQNKRQWIAEFNFEKLRDALQEGEVSCVDVLRTYQERAIVSHQKTNCITFFIEEADEWAASLDKKAKELGFKKPPFFGIPFSIKETIKVCGYDQTKGYARELGKFAREDSLIVQQIKYLGGIPFVFTNIPQGLLTYGCSNPIYGTTCCLYDSSRTSGGSSGGEGALIGSGGSIIGIGSDVGGSLRYPCHFNGITGIKPSHLRLSSLGGSGSIPGRPYVDYSDGPMATEVSTLVSFLREIWKDNWISGKDPYVPPVPWNELQFSKKHFRIGFYENDGWFQATPSLVRAVKESCERLQRMGHQVEQFRLPDMKEAFQLFLAAVTVDGGKYLLEKLSNDIMMDDYRTTVTFYKIPVTIQHIFAYVLSPLFPRIAAVLNALPSNTSQLREIYEKILNFREKFVKLMFEQNLDALICPIQVTPAIGHHYPMKLFPATSYCGVYNMLDFAAGTVRVTTVTDADEAALETYPSTDVWYRMAKTATQGSVGLPVGVQVVAPPYHEETVLKIMLELEQSVLEQPIL